MKRFILLLLMAAAGLHAQDKLTLDQALALALENNLQIGIARNSRAIAENSAHPGGAGLLPKIDLSGSASYQDQTLAGQPADASTVTRAEVLASYTLFDGFGNIYRMKKLNSEKVLGQLSARDQIESTLLAVSQAYYNAASAKEQLNIARELLTISRERLARTQEQSRFGRARTVDVLSAQVDFNSDSVTVAQSDLIWHQARRNLNSLLGREIEQAFDVDVTVPFTSLPGLDAIQTEAMANNASYRSAFQSERQALLNYRIAQGAHLPRVALSASYGYSQTAGDWAVGLDDPNKTLKAGATVSFNLFNGFQTSVNRQNAKISLDSQKLRKEQARLDLETDVANAWAAYRNSRLVMTLEEKNLEAAELNFTRTEELYRLGQVTSTQFREAQLNLIRAKSGIADAKYDAKLGELDLLRISGRILTVVEGE